MPATGSNQIKIILGILLFFPFIINNSFIIDYR